MKAFLKAVRRVLTRDYLGMFILLNALEQTLTHTRNERQQHWRAPGKLYDMSQEQLNQSYDYMVYLLGRIESECQCYLKLDKKLFGFEHYFYNQLEINRTWVETVLIGVSTLRQETDSLFNMAKLQKESGYVTGT